MIDGDDLGREHGQERQGGSKEDAEGTDQVLLLLAAFTVTGGVINGYKDGTQDD